VSFDVLFQVLWSLEGFATQVTFVRLERHVHSDVRGDMIALDRGSSTIAPLTSQVEVVGRLPANMSFAYMLLVARQSHNELQELAGGQ
jgi:hypothetical protein